MLFKNLGLVKSIRKIKKVAVGRDIVRFSGLYHPLTFSQSRIHHYSVNFLAGPCSFLDHLPDIDSGLLGKFPQQNILKIIKNNNKSSSAEILQQDGYHSNSIQKLVWIMSGIATEQLPRYLQSSKAHLKEKKIRYYEIEKQLFQPEHDLVTYSLNMRIHIQKVFLLSKASPRQS